MRQRAFQIPKATAAIAMAAASVALGQAQPPLPSTVYIYPMGSFAENAMISSLAGVVNQTTNGELLLSPDNGFQPNPRFWLDQLKLSYPQVQSVVEPDELDLLNRYKSKVSGYIRYDTSTNPNSLNIATSIAGVTNAIIVDSSTRLTAVIAGIPQLVDARNMTYEQAYQTYGAQFNKNIIVHQALNFDHHLRDFAIQNKAFVYYTSPTALDPTTPAGSSPYASNQNHQGRIFGWADSEFDLFQQASQKNQQVVASNYSWSTSTTSNWKVPVAAQKSHPSPNVVTQSGKHYVSFVMSDGDNAQWLTNGFGTDPKWFGSPYRGNFNMTWDFTPSLMDMNPVAHNYIYQHAAEGAHTDTFVDAGGAGTSFPSVYPDINGLAADTAAAMAKADLKVTSILDPTYSKSKLSTILAQDQVMGIMYKAYANFYRSTAANMVDFDSVSGKPIVSVKYSLWDGADTAVSIANALNANTHRNALDDSASYTIVNVHPWSVLGPNGTGSGDPMSNLNTLVGMLDPMKVEVVGLEELMVNLRNHFGKPVPGAIVSATWTGSTSSQWNTRSNWSGALPNFPDAIVNFGAATNRSVSVNTAVTAGTINFNNTLSYTLLDIFQPITLDTTTGNAAINVQNGSHTIAGTLNLADNTTITVTLANNSLTLNKLAAAPTRDLTKAGAGTLTVNALNVAALNLTAGTVRLASSAATASKVTSLQIDAGARVDIANNKLIIDYASTSASPITTIANHIRSGRNGTDFLGGNWNGTTGIVSNAAAASDLVSFAVGYVDNSFLPSLGLPSYTSFGGQTVDSSSVLVRYTRGADANLDGKVNTDDVTIVGALYNSVGSDEWFLGDFDYDGTCDTDDVTVLGALYDATAPALSEAQLTAQYGGEFAAAFERGRSMGSGVPEPGAGLLIFALPVLAGKRRTGSRRIEQTSGAAVQ